MNEQQRKNRVDSMIEVLDVADQGDIKELEESLLLMSDEAINILYELIFELTEMADANNQDEDFPEVPKLLRPIDVKMANHPAEMMKSLAYLPSLGRRIHDAFREGRLGNMKRYLRVNNRITKNCQKFVANQLWDNLSENPPRVPLKKTASLDSDAKD